ncbi:2OG-Fe dioxygenase family protein [Streptomyces sp. PR69]|uniref:2OG-Fe dioxygenase family protein n=1 Tax=Streptomyces sp. PR69 TaxID=2984950 RepID=UPI002264972C|nr:2OG-Fe dioxygenase family protein [Streptomyces sp. PR69]
MSLNDQGFVVIDTPALDDYTLGEFGKLPMDPYTGSAQRYRRFSQFRLRHEGAWTLELLPHRHFSQPRQFNDLVGGQLRTLEPLTVDPTPLIAAGADALGLDKGTDWQLNVHQCRVVSTPDVKGVAAPEGPHRDGHHYGIVAVTRRHNISGGETQLMPLGGGEPFFRTTLRDGQAIAFDDRVMFHHVTDIEHLTDEGGHRDVWLVAVNPWEQRRYGEEYEAEVLAGGRV